jgi:hypothetical protein
LPGFANAHRKIRGKHKRQALADQGVVVDYQQLGLVGHRSGLSERKNVQAFANAGCLGPRLFNAGIPCAKHRQFSPDYRQFDRLAQLCDRSGVDKLPRSGALHQFRTNFAQRDRKVKRC